eukprot:1185426-Prorocentrum_minimum.AAC.1
MHAPLTVGFTLEAKRTAEDARGPEPEARAKEVGEGGSGSESEKEEEDDEKGSEEEAEEDSEEEAEEAGGGMKVHEKLAAEGISIPKQLSQRTVTVRVASRTR